jgi:hypothetical protein
MSTVLTLKHPFMSMLAIWVWILNSLNRLTQAVEYAGLNFTSYAIIQSKYIPAKNERLMTSQPASNPRMSSSCSS